MVENDPCRVAGCPARFSNDADQLIIRHAEAVRYSAPNRLPEPVIVGERRRYERNDPGRYPRRSRPDFGAESSRSETEPRGIHPGCRFSKLSGMKGLDEVLGTAREQVSASGISDDELTALFTSAREEVHRSRP
jgi:hypothetical protein